MASGAWAGDDEGAEDPGFRFGTLRLSGLAEQRFRYRSGDGAEDQDLLGRLALDAEEDPAQVPEGRPEFAFRLDASWRLDVDRFGGTSDESVIFFEPTDTFDGRLHGILHAAWAEARGLPGIERVRAGRQFLRKEAGFLFDGVFARTRRVGRTAFELWGGLPAHPWESSASGDAVAGGGVDVEPLPELRLTADAIFLRDARDGVGATEDVLTVLGARWHPAPEWRFAASASWDDTRDRRQLVEARWLDAESGFLAHLRLLRQNGIVEFRPAEISPFFLVQGAYAPYHEAVLDFHRPLGEHLGVGAGGRVRRLEDPDDAGRFNHSFRNVWAAIDARGPWPGLEVTVRGDVWDADGEDIWTGGVEASQELPGRVRLRTGTSYSLWRFDLLTGEERERDRLWWAGARWEATENLRLDLEYRYERDSSTEYHTVIGGVRLWF